MITFIRHDTNSAHDIKMMKLLKVYNNQGFGIYWRLVELLAQADGKLKADYDSLGWELREDPETIKAIINEFDLFIVDDEGFFYSNRLNKELANFNEKSEKAKRMAAKRWQKKAEEEKADAEAKEEQCPGNTETKTEQCSSNAQAMPKHENSDATAMPEHSPSNAEAMRLDKIRLDKIREDKNNNIPPLPPKGERLINNVVVPENLSLLLIKPPEKLNKPEFIEAWKEWEKYRKEKRQALKPTTIKKQFDFLSKFDVGTAVQIINQSIMNGWTGLFELKRKNGYTPPTNLSTSDKLDVMKEFLNGD